MESNQAVVSKDLTDKIYAECGHWTRTVNTVIWPIAAIFIPLSLSPLVALAYHADLKPLAFGLFLTTVITTLSWLYIDRIYTNMVRHARTTLEEIEIIWGLPKKIQFYTAQNDIVNLRLSVTMVCTFGCIFIYVAWAVYSYQHGFFETIIQTSSQFISRHMNLFNNLSDFLAGAFACNSIPHITSGLRGEKFPTPFATPRRVGVSHPVTNTVWGGLNAVVAWVLLCYSPLSIDGAFASFLFFLGFLSLGVYLSRRFAARKISSPE